MPSLTALDVDSAFVQQPRRPRQPPFVPPPLLMAAATLPPPLIPRRRPREDHEIIDVDLLDDDEIIITGYGRSQRRRISHDPPRFTTTRPSPFDSREVIVLSDDEAEASNPRPSGHRRRLISPPPPAIHHLPPPPVPSLPLHIMLGGRRSRPRTPHPPPPPAILPNPNPFAFEAQLQQATRPRSSTPTPILPPRGAPPSHHQPVMGLGGAIISMNRASRPTQPSERLHDRVSQEETQRRNRVFRITEFSNWVTDMLENHRRPNANFRADIWPFGDFDAADFDHFHGMPSMDEVLSQARQPKVAEAMWKPEYTHDSKPIAGYSYNFTPEDLSPASPTPIAGSSFDRAIVVLDDDDNTRAGPSSPSSQSLELAKALLDAGSTLVCARCMEPLLLSGEGSENLAEEDQKSRRVWGLRCGHVLDGKCVHSIMQPPPSCFVPDEKGKGKAKATPQLVTTGSTTRRGKGVARGEIASELDMLSRRLPGEFPGQPSIPDESIRSRLRPRHSRSDSSQGHPPPTSVTHASSECVGRSHSRSRARDPARPQPYPKGKGRGKARKSVVMEQFEWACPVLGCGRVHRSINLKGGDGWTMDPEKGAIAMFI